MLDVIANRYTIMNLVGQGGMADVYLAYDEILQRKVAMKILRTKLAEDPMTLVRFTREASAASRLSHPNVVDIYDVGEWDGLHYIVMEYIKGPTLKQMIQHRGALDEKEAVSIMKQLVSAVLQAHAHNIIHRDIKPQNILVKGDGTIKITDFGIAVASDVVSLTGSNAVIGSAHYLAPEAAQGQIPDERVDIYSMGIVFYELLTGEVPFKGTTAAQIALKHLKDPMLSVREFNPALPTSIENIITKATAKDPQERYSSAALMLEDLLVCLKPEHAKDPLVILKTTSLDVPGRSVRKEEDAAGDTGSVQPIHAKSLESMKPVREGRSRMYRWILAAACLILVFMGCFGLFYTGVIRLPGIMGYETFPELDGLSEEEAMKILHDDGFSLAGLSVEKEVSDSVEKGNVIRCDIRAGKVVKTDTPITLTVSKGESYMIKNYTGMALTDVQARLKEDGVNMTYTLTTQGVPNTIPGIIMAQDNLLPGDRVDPDGDNELILTISDYPTIVIPETLLGMDINEAKTWLNDQGIAVSLSPAEGGSGIVQDVWPAPGTEYRQEGTDSVVTLYH